MENMKKGLDGFTLKIIALILMVFDHVHYFAVGLWDVPLWFTMLGRLSAPIFIYLVTVGMSHTRNPQKYMLRLYIGSLFMAVGNQIVNTCFPLPSGGIVINNIFGTLFIITFMIYAAQKISENKADIKQAVKYIALFLLPVFTSAIPLLGMAVPGYDHINLFMILVFLFPSVLACEGSFILIILGLGFYFFRNSKKKTAIFYLLFCLIDLFLGYNPEYGLVSMFLHNIQWMMVFALPLILLYNGQRGKGMKYFFYVFYPAHIYLLAIVAYFLAN